jgi:predicted PurR-regulated permease PerM
MYESSKRSKGTQSLITVAAFVIVVAGMRAAEKILVPFLLSAFLAIICAPPLFWLRRKHVPTALALLIVIGGIMGIGLIMGTLVGASVKDFSAALPVYQTRLQEQTRGLIAWSGRIGLEISDQVLLEYFDPGAAMRLVAKTLTRLGGVLTNAFFILLTVIFMLLEASSFPDKLRVILGPTNPTLANFDKITNDVKGYMARKTLVSLATGICIAIWLAILGVNYPLLWGLLAFFLNFVPNIGSIIAAIPAVLLALVQLGTGSALLTALGFLVVNSVIGSVIEPRFMGRGLGLSTLVVFLSLVFWGWVLGPVGMLLSVPLTLTVKIALEGNEDTRWIAILLGPGGIGQRSLVNTAQSVEGPKKGLGPQK